MIRAAAALFFAAVLTATASAAQVMDFDVDDPQMNAAVRQAQRTLPLFLESVLDGKEVSAPDVLVKVAMPRASDPTTNENIWVDQFQRVGPDRFLGSLANEPVDLAHLALGSRIFFSQEQIVDWSVLSPDGRFHGNYTSRVMHDRGAFAGEEYDDIFMPDPLPPGWM
jgi:uncharacterized protein YegJ (DUF2314 family)